MLKLFLATTLHVGLGLGPTGGWNSIHPGVRYEEGPWSLGAYVNSERGISPFASYTFDFDGCFLEGGIVGGYSTAPVLPMVRAGCYVSEELLYFVSPGAAVDQYGRVMPGFVFGAEVSF